VAEDYLRAKNILSPADDQLKIMVRSAENLYRAPEMYSRTTPKSKDEGGNESRERQC
jgi:hypothetical protein